MILGKRTLEKLRELINEETTYRSGPQIIRFFNELGFSDTYGRGFPSRWVFTDEKLNLINGKPQLDQCIRNVLAPIEFVGRYDDLDSHISSFNQYLTFDKWKLIRNGAELEFKKLEKIEIDDPKKQNTENEFLAREFTNVDVSSLGLEGVVTDVLNRRIEEIQKCFSAKAPLSVILLAGSTLEGIFLGLANKYPAKFNSSTAVPKDNQDKPKKFHEWSLAAFIDVARSLDLIQHDTQKFSHSLRDFRNYIHPFEQMSSGFNPREHTAKICLQVLKATISELNENSNKLRT